MIRKFNFVAIFFILIFLTFNLFLSVEISKAKEGNVSYVGGSGLGNYSYIQDAINNSFAGETVFIFAGNYSETIVINKSISLLGSNKTNVLIDGGDGLYSILIKSSGVTVSGFTIQNSNVGILISGYNYKICNISNNIIRDNFEGVRLINSSSNVISENLFYKHNNFAIVMYDSSNNSILRNKMVDNDNGIYLGRWSNSNLISENNFTDYKNGINLEYSFYNLISRNQLMNGSYGIYLSSTKQNTITNNSFEFNNQAGIYIIDSDENVITPNIFLNNNQDVYKKTKPPSIRTPGFESFFVFLIILFVILLKK